jgi:hypothetical protein
VDHSNFHTPKQETDMGISPLDPASASARPDRKINQGHGTRALGPSDSSDSGSDLAGPDAGAGVGDANLDSDSDRFGTGERAAAEGDDARVEGADIETDHIESIPGETGEEDDEDAKPA